MLPSRGLSVFDVQLRILSDLCIMQPHGPPSGMLEKSRVRVKWEAVLTGAAKISFHGMTTVIGVTCLNSMIYLPAYLHLCESAEALGSGIACYRLYRT